MREPVALLASSRPSPPPSPKGRGSTALDELAKEVANQVAASAQPPVAVYVHSPAPKLARGFTTLLVAELSAQKLAGMAIDGGEAPEAAARRVGARSLVRLDLSLEEGTLAARGDLLGTWVNFWSGAAPTRPAQPAAALAASTQADAHALVLATVSLATTSTDASTALRLIGASFARLNAPSAALAAGDLDGDGKEEIAALTDEEVLLFSSDGRLLARHEHRTLPPSEAPCREPFGAIAVTRSPARVAYFSSRRARGELLAWEKGSLRAIAPLTEAPVAQLAEGTVWGQMLPGLNSFAAELTWPGKGNLQAEAPVQALSTQGEWVLAIQPDGTAPLGRGPTHLATRIGDVPVGSALVDVDGDGLPELVLSAEPHTPEKETLRIFSLKFSLKGERDPSGNALLWEGPVPRGRVLQIVAADIDGDKRAELILGTWLADGTGELHLFRRISP
ncbi:MAG: FG-GAP repeat domain-containing protein [Myxococcota bacterium]